MKHLLEKLLKTPEQVDAFVQVYGTLSGRALANRLNITGPGSTKAAKAISNYAWNKFTANNLRDEGRPVTALEYDTICDRIKYELELI